MVMSMAETWGSLGSGMAALMFAWTMYQNYFPRELRGYFSKYTKKISYYFYPYIQINFPEYQGDDFQRSRAYTAIQRYLDKSSSDQARRLKANVIHGSESIVFTMEANEEVTDEFRGIKLWWSSRHHIPDRQTISWGGRDEEKKSFNLTFHKKHRETVTVDYLKYVLEQGKEIAVKERRRKLYTNIKGEGRWFERQRMWSHITFEHPASFETLAMESKKKQEIIDDLINFSNSKNYYAKVGKAWKRGYLLYGPPGTGKSTMIAAMANLLKYDVYDLELTSVKDNTDLRKLLIDTSSKSIIVIEDIDCSLDLTGQREKGKAGQNEKDKDKDKDKEKEKSVEEIVKKKMEESKKSSEVTLSGLLNFIDGLWSSCGEERIIVFTTNYVEKLDPALIRRGRMDKRIELSYCGLQAFKDLAKIYLNVEWHDLFAKVGSLLEVTKMTPADVAENLMPKFVGEDVEFCLERLIVALGEAKVEQDAKAKAEEEAKAKAEEEAKAKAEEEAKTKAEEDAKAKVKAEEEAKSKALATSAETKTENGTESVSKSSSETENVAKEVKENGCTSTTNGN